MKARCLWRTLFFCSFSIRIADIFRADGCSEGTSFPNGVVFSKESKLSLKDNLACDQTVASVHTLPCIRVMTEINGILQKGNSGSRDLSRLYRAIRRHSTLLIMRLFFDGIWNHAIEVVHVVRRESQYVLGGETGFGSKCVRHYESFTMWNDYCCYRAALNSRIS